MMYRAAWYGIPFVVISLCSVGIAVANGAGPSNLQHSALAFRTDAPIPLDGDLTAWRGADTVMFTGKPLGSHPRSAIVYTLWDQENLYLAFDVHSSKLQASVREHDGDKPWEDDGVEFLIDARLQRTKEFLRRLFVPHQYNECGI